MINLRWRHLLGKTYFVINPPTIPTFPLVIKSINHEQNYDSKCLFFIGWQWGYLYRGLSLCCNLPLQSVNIPVFVAVVQTSIVVYSMLQQNREGRQNTILGNSNTSPGQALSERAVEYNSLVWLWPPATPTYQNWETTSANSPGWSYCDKLDRLRRSEKMIWTGCVAAQSWWNVGSVWWTK